MSASNILPELLSPQLIALSDLVPDPANARRHPERNMQAVMASLRSFGQHQPIVVQKQGMIVRVGNARPEAARQLGWEHIAAIVVDENDVQAVARAIADNRTAELAEWDEAELGAQLEALRGENIDLGALGYTASELNRILEKSSRNAASDGSEDDCPEPPKRAISREGDLWLLGAHRLLCGDSTIPENVIRLMNGERSLLCSTDPPYLVDYTGMDHPTPKGSKGSEKSKNKKGGWDEYKGPDQASDLYAGYLKCAIEYALGDRPVFYQWHASMRHSIVSAVWEKCGIFAHQQLIWSKKAGVLTHSHYLWKHEPCLYGWLRGLSPTIRPPSTMTTIWEIDAAGEPRVEHPTQKPVEIFRRPIMYHTLKGDICYEPFSGSGSQIVAAEQLQRRCFAIEKEPTFVDVAIMRWQGLYGKQAMLDGGGGSWDEVSKTRGSEDAPA